MFKKTLIAVAALGALAGTASAADVTVYGRIDTGLRYQNVDYDVQGADDKSSFEMVSGNNTGSRFGLKGGEDLGNGMKLSFVLENGFDGDDGSFDSNGDRMFGREASLSLEGGFGKIGFGRMGILNSTAGSYAIGQFTPFGSGWGAVGDQTLIFGASFGTRYSNMISYQTPDFAGFKVHAQYSFGETNETEKEFEGKTTTDRYYALGATYKNGGLNLIGIVDSVNEKHQASEDLNAEEPDDTIRVTIGGSYDFGVVKPYVAAAYFKDAKVKRWLDAYKINGKGTAVNTRLEGDWDGYGIAIGATAPLVGGTLYTTLGYMDAEEQSHGVVDGTADLTRWTFGVGYQYPLSKRTYVYGDAGYFKDSFDYGDRNQDDVEPEGYQAAIGLVHMF